MSSKFLILAVPSAAVLLLGVDAPRMFESKPRVVAAGRDPMLSVRASGALSLLKVDKGNLWLQTSFDGGDSFDEGVRVNDIAGEVSSHGESTPQLQVRTRSEFYCLWQARRAGADVAALRFARSLNWGESFSKAIDVDARPGAGSQGFFTMNVSPKGVVYVAWLDGRDRGKGRAGTSAVYLARSTDKGGSFDPPVRVALDVCPCCRPSIGFSGERNVHVSWRGVLDGNVRDIFVGTSQDDGVKWGTPRRVAEDNWVLNGCPHSGAALASLGKQLYIAWYTVRDQNPALYAAWSEDAGQTFSRRIALSEGVIDPNHPFMLPAGDRLSLVFQGRDPGESEGWGRINAYYREIDSQGRMSQLERLGQAGGSVSYPTFAFEEPGRFYVTWAEPSKEGGKVIVMSRGRRFTRPHGERDGAQ